MVRLEWIDKNYITDSPSPNLDSKEEWNNDKAQIPLLNQICCISQPFKIIAQNTYVSDHTTGTLVRYIKVNYPRY